MTPSFDLEVRRHPRRGRAARLGKVAGAAATLSKWAEIAEAAHANGTNESLAETHLRGARQRLEEALAELDG